jgi:hypothetical protein
MLIEEIVIGVGMVMIVVVMALILNPPESLVKRVYHRTSKTTKKDEAREE